MSEFKLNLKGKAIALIDWANIRNQQKKLGWEIDLEKLFVWLKTHEQIERIQFFYGYFPQTKEIKNIDIFNLEKLEIQKFHKETQQHIKSKKFLKKVENFGYEIITKEIKNLKVKIEDSHFRKNLKSLKTELSEIRRVYGQLDESEESYAFAEELHYSGFFKNSEKIESISEEINQTIKVPKCDFDVEITTEIIKNFSCFDTIILFSGDGDFAYPILECLNHRKKVYIISGFERGKWSSIGKEIWDLEIENPKKYPTITIINLKNLNFLKKIPASQKKLTG